MKTLFLTDPDCSNHLRSGHPEKPERLTAILNLLGQSGLLDDMQSMEITPANDSALKRVHSESYIKDLISAEPQTAFTLLDPDTYMSPGSMRAARLAAGACITAAKMVLDGHARNAFCAVRPPGHHAETARAMGFCLLNNIAVGANWALDQDQIERVAILDFDVHHCNGTVEIFKDRKEVLVCSSFQQDHYPYRFLDYTNEHILNLPLQPGSGSREFREGVEKTWLPALEAHKPDFIFISAGFDAHKDDPLGDLELEESDYSWVTHQIGRLAATLCSGRVVSTLEGGYNLDSLARSVHSHLQGLIEAK